MIYHWFARDRGVVIRFVNFYSYRKYLRTKSKNLHVTSIKILYRELSIYLKNIYYLTLNSNVLRETFSFACCAIFFAFNTPCTAFNNRHGHFFSSRLPFDRFGRE